MTKLMLQMMTITRVTLFVASGGAAKMLGITVPPTMLGRADEVIE